MQCFIHKYYKLVIKGFAGILLSFLYFSTPVYAVDFLSDTRDGKKLISRYLLNFGRFIEWPTNAFASEESSFKLCVIGKNPLSESLSRSLKNKKARKRKFDISVLEEGQIEDAKNCNILYISTTEETAITEITQALSGLPVLTVGEADRFPENGGMIGLRPVKGDQVSIKMHKKVIADANLKVGEKLLRAIR